MKETPKPTRRLNSKSPTPETPRRRSSSRKPSPSEAVVLPSVSTPELQYDNAGSPPDSPQKPAQGNNPASILACLFWLCVIGFGIWFRPQLYSFASTSILPLFDGSKQSSSVATVAPTNGVNAPVAQTSRDQANPAPVDNSTLRKPLKRIDEKDGFRNLVFGANIRDLPKMSVVKENAQTYLKKAQSSEEVLSLNGVQLESVSYYFYQDRLMSVEITWDISWSLEQAASGPCPTRLDDFCTKLWDKPDKDHNESSRLHYADRTTNTLERTTATQDHEWNGSRVRATFSEHQVDGYFSYGVWRIPPKVSGRLYICNIELSNSYDKTVESVDVRSAKSKRDGL